jgi:uncharacterized phiE125 gp8 family phage protein
MSLRLISESTTEPVSLDDVKQYLRLSTSDTSEDLVLAALVKTSRIYAETKTKRPYVAKTFRLTLDSFPDGGIELPYPPLSTVAGIVTVNYINSSGATAHMNSSSIVVDAESEPAMIFPSTADDNDWPDTNDVVNAVTIQYETTCNPPENVKTWIKLKVGTLYENRQEFDSKPIYELKRDYIDGLIDNECLPEVY